MVLALSTMGASHQIPWTWIWSVFQVFHIFRISLLCSRLFHLSERPGISEASQSNKKTLSTLDFSLSFATMPCVMFSSGHIFHSFSLCSWNSYKALLVALETPHHIFLTPPMHTWSDYLSWVTCPCFFLLLCCPWGTSIVTVGPSLGQQRVCLGAIWHWLHQTQGKFLAPSHSSHPL